MTPLPRLEALLEIAALGQFADPKSWFSQRDAIKRLLAERLATALMHTPLSGGLSLMATLRRARVMLAGNVAFASAFETILLQISEEYAKWPW